MKKFETDVTIAVYADPEYRYEVSAGDMFSVDYIEGVDRQTHIGFGSRDEMITVAKAMLKVAELNDV